MKDAVDGNRSVFPSLISRVLPGNEPSAIDISNKAAVESVINDYLENMDITTQSASVNINGRYLVGANVTNNGQIALGFNVNSTEGKHKSDVSLICLFGLLAYEGLKKAYSESKQVPGNIVINVPKMTTALPIDEFKMNGVKNEYAHRFSNNEHVVIINNFTRPITVKILFKKVDVQPEGVIAQYGLIGSKAKNEDYRHDALFEDFKKKYGLKSFTGKDVSEKRYILLIDVGEGTVDFSVLHQFSPVPQINSSINMGTGNVVEGAIKSLRSQYPMIGQVNRQSFVSIANRGDDNESKAYRQVLGEQLITIEELINEQIKSIYAALNAQIDLVVLCGGGIKTIRPDYEKKLDNVIDLLSPFGPADIMWVPDKYTQFLNLDGLEFRLKFM